MILIDGMNRIRALIQADIFKCQSGTGTNSPTEDDTGLQTPDATTLDTPTISTSSQAIQVTFDIPSTTGAGTAYSEEEIQMNAGTDHLNRVVHTAITKCSNDEFTYITNIFIKRV